MMLEKPQTDSQVAPRATLEKHRQAIDRELLKELSKHEDTAFHFPLKNATKGGRRLRPILLILAHKTIKEKATKAFPAAIAVELAHLESLIHDDIIDRDAERRKSASFHVLYGYEMAILSADYILSIILKLTSRYKDPRIPQTLAEATAKMGEGELEEFRISDGSQNMTLDKYLEIVEKKTAALFQASATIGAIIAGANSKETNALADYGRLLGTAYQIQDDIADLNKKTRINILTLLGNPEISMDQLRTTSRNRIENAKRSIGKLKECKAKRLLMELAESIASPSVGDIQGSVTHSKKESDRERMG